LSGLSVCRELRAQAKTATCPIILLTARCFDEDIQAVMDLGGITYMGKPFEFAHLLKMLWSSVGLEQPGNAGAPRVISGASQS
jgi:DNA-binding response OmpR family regulator